MDMTALLEALKAALPLLQALAPLGVAATKLGADALVDAMSSGKGVDEKLSSLLDLMTSLQGSQDAQRVQLAALERLVTEVQAINREQTGRLGTLESDQLALHTQLAGIRSALRALTDNGASHP